jgi:hypothetical protein
MIVDDEVDSLWRTTAVIYLKTSHNFSGVTVKMIKTSVWVARSPGRERDHESREYEAGEQII